MDIVEDMTTEVVEREYEGMVLIKHWIGDEVERHGRTHQKREITKSGC
jgi:hypothetical protein